VGRSGVATGGVILEVGEAVAIGIVVGIEKGMEERESGVDIALESAEVDGAEEAVVARFKRLPVIGVLKRRPN